jgi:hypothetical protein
MGDPLRKTRAARTDYVCPKKEALVNELLNPTGKYKLVQQPKRKVKRIYNKKRKASDAE